MNAKNEESIHEVWKEYKDTDDLELKNYLIEHYLDYVRNISYKVFKRMKGKVRQEDLMSFGVDGLMSAVERYDLDEGVKFETYAYQRIRGSMIDGLRSEDTVPRSVRSRYKKINQKVQEMQTESQGKVRKVEALKSLDIDVEDYFKNQHKYKPANSISISKCLSNEQTNGKDKLSYCLEQDCTKDPSHSVDNKDLVRSLLKSNLSTFERKLIYHYYYEGLTMRKISEIYDMSESRISQLHKEIITKLRIKTQQKDIND